MLGLDLPSSIWHIICHFPTCWTGWGWVSNSRRWLFYLLLTCGRKSQLAIEFSYQLRERSPDIWIFCIHASNLTRFEQSCQQIADRLKIPARTDPKADTFKLIRNWLDDWRNGKWLLILDNLDQDLRHGPPTSQGESASREASPGEPLLAYLPPNPNGSIIITSRSKSVASRIVEEDEIIEIDSMDEAHAIAPFEKKLGMQDNREDIIEHTELLEFMPLAIIQAASYIRQRAPRFSVLQYLQQFRENNRKALSLLDRGGGHLR